MQSSLVLVVDVQERLAAAMPTERMERVAPKAAALVRGAALLGIPVLATEQYPRGLGPTIDSLQEALGGAPVVEKTVFSVAGLEEVQALLAEHPEAEILVLGMEAHVCVWQSIRDLLAAGRKVAIVTDAVCSRNEEDRQVAIKMAKAAGARRTTSEAELFSWIGDAQHEHFKAISRLVR